MFSLGAIIYYMMKGANLIKGFSPTDVLANTLKMPFSEYICSLDDYSLNAKRFILWCLERNPDDRPSAEQAMSHPWFKSVLKKQD